MPEVRRTGWRPSCRARYVISSPSRTANWTVSSEPAGELAGTRRRTPGPGRSSRGTRRRARLAGGRARSRSRPVGRGRRRRARRRCWRSTTSAGPAAERARSVRPRPPPFSASTSRIARRAGDRRRERLALGDRVVLGSNRVGHRLLPARSRQRTSGHVPVSLMDRVQHIDFRSRCRHTVQPTAGRSVCWTMRGGSRGGPPPCRGSDRSRQRSA